MENTQDVLIFVIDKRERSEHKLTMENEYLKLAKEGCSDLIPTQVILGDGDYSEDNVGYLNEYNPDQYEIRVHSKFLEQVTQTSKLTITKETVTFKNGNQHEIIVARIQ